MRYRTAILPPMFPVPSDNEKASAFVAQNARYTQGFRNSVTYPTAPVSGLTVAGWWSILLGTTGGAYTTLWQAKLERIVHRSIAVMYANVTDASGAGVTQLRLTGVGVDHVTVDYTLAPASNNIVTFNWLHEVPVWDTDDLTLSIRSKITAGTCTVYAPYGGGVVQREPDFASTTEGL